MSQSVLRGENINVITMSDSFLMSSSTSEQNLFANHDRQTVQRGVTLESILSDNMH